MSGGNFRETCLSPNRKSAIPSRPPSSGTCRRTLSRRSADSGHSPAQASALHVHLRLADADWRRINWRALKNSFHPGPGARRACCLWLLALGGALAGAAELRVEISPAFESVPLQLDSARHPLPGGETIAITRLSYLLGGFALEKTGGGWAELPGQFAWLDAARSRNQFTLENIPAGEYRAFRFTVGLDSETNKGDPARHPAGHPLNPNLNGLHWTWQSGYIFLALEGMFTERRPPARPDGKPPAPNAVSENGAPRGFSYHFARDPNRTVITLPVQLNLSAASAPGVKLAFDVAALLNAPRRLSPARDGESTHSRADDPIAAALKANLPGAFQVRQIVADTRAAAAPVVKPLYLPAKFTPYRFTMSGVFPVPDLPKDNPLLEERVALGRALFHEKQLSRDNSLACASCHVEAAAFTDPRRYSLGVEARTGTRNAMPLFNLAWKNSFFWDGRAPSLRAQALLPIQDHTEMDEKLERVVEKLQSSKPEYFQTTPSQNSKFKIQNLDYPALFAAAFDSPEITPEKIGLALENFLLTLTSFDSKFDRAMRGAAELTELEKRGFELFFTESDPRREQFGADCFHCHGGALFTDNQFHNNGLMAFSDEDTGRFKVTGNESDRGKFSTPSLRNVALTAPYMHDGRFATLEEVTQHYHRGVQRSPTLDPNLAKHPRAGLPIGPEDQRALVAFMKTLTDEKYLPPPAGEKTQRSSSTP
ncbi:MAG: cytochrome C peroxidase [Verrucomicrobia bacterium]|nr:cytochrome C peroxidase [Verrucomicrobiota bacterium]